MMRALKERAEETLHAIEKRAEKTLKAEDGMAVVEVILIIVVLIGLVIIFQSNIKGVVASIFSTIQRNASSVK